jgi:hypothetical protein
VELAWDSGDSGYEDEGEGELEEARGPGASRVPGPLGAVQLEGWLASGVEEDWVREIRRKVGEPGSACAIAGARVPLTYGPRLSCDTASCGILCIMM